MKNFVFMCLGGAIAVLAFIVSQAFLLDKTSSSGQVLSQEPLSQEPSVLYWVAPMDANFRRDQPGQSPMGMDLVPVYANASGDTQKGVVEISAAVGNNLGVKSAEVEWTLPELSFISSGQVNYAKESLVHLHARTSGWVEKLHISDMGQRVKKGQALYGIYSLEFIDAQKDYLRALNSHNESLMRAAKNRLQALRVDNKVIEKLKRTKSVSQITTFYAPQDGYIEQLNINEGMYVKPENTLLAIADLNQLTVDVELDHQHAAWLSQFPGQIQWTLSSQLMPTKVWQGKLDYIYPMMNEELRTLRVRLLVDNNDQLLKPNMWLNLKGNITAAEKSLLIPSQALIRTENDTRVVMALGEGRFKSVSVNIGRFFNQNVEILQGLQAGDRIVTSAQFLIDSESNIDSDLQRMEASMIDGSDMDDSGMESHDDH
ncbi:Putatie cation efflux system protein [Oleispira antarctica RB-8]|uniref:Putatie cation efflux system protein n=1 Tax=Oleispira antarctica RB-8 TaxID=698738 RepID=R4YQ63_OLEAN|nr:Putatie cation efflux system protein [Oleispira antarctica RB-8]